jgi:hypothetical protein
MAEDVLDLPKNLPRRYEQSVPIDSLSEFPGNPKDHDIGAIMQSMQENGIYKGLFALDDEKRFILAGHGTKEALKRLGVTEIDVVWVSGLSMKAAKRIIVADNRTSQLGGWNEPALYDMMREIMSEDGTAGTGYDDEDIEHMRRLLEADKQRDEDVGDSSVLKALSVTVAEPKHQVKRGEVWRLGEHVLICCDLITEHSMFTPYLSDDDDIMFCPLASPLLPLAKVAKTHKLVIVQPDEFIAGHTADHYAEVRGEKHVSRIESEE